MLSRERFETESPNVVDPGEETPAPPTRRFFKDDPNEDGNDGPTHPHPNRPPTSTGSSSSISSDSESRLYTRTGNKGAISKGIKLVVESDDSEAFQSEDFQSEDLNDDEDNDGDDEEEVAVVFERSSDSSSLARSRSGSVGSVSTSTDSIVSDLNRIEHMYEDGYTDKKKKRKKRRPGRRNDGNNRINLDVEEEESGISSARLFAAAVLNETEKRQVSFRNIMNWEAHDRTSYAPQGNALRKMMQRAGSFRVSLGMGNHDNRQSFMDFSSDEQPKRFRRNSLGLSMDDRRSSMRNIYSLEEQEENILVKCDAEKFPSDSSENSLIPKRRARVAVMLLVAILLVAGFSFLASSSRSSLRSSSNSQPSTAEAEIAHALIAAEVMIANDARLGEIVSYLSGAEISSDRNLYEASSPQFKAALWMAEEDSENVPLPDSVSGGSAQQGLGSTTSSHDSGTATTTTTETEIMPFNFVQRYVLAVLYFATGGTDWAEKYYFASIERHECSWYKQILPLGSETEDNDESDGNGNGNGSNSNSNTKTITIANTNTGHGTYSERGVVCDRDLRVRGISLPANNLRGTIPSEIRYLTHLQWLQLNDNFLTGMIPEDMRFLSHLEDLDLGNNTLTGQMTPYFWLTEQLRNLKKLDLSNNQLTLLPFFDKIETIDDRITKTRREPVGGEKSLVRLALGGNDNTRANTNTNNIMKKEEKDVFVDSAEAVVLPTEFRYLPNLQELSLDNMGLGGTIPVWLFHELPELRILDLSHNHMTGTVVDGFHHTTSDTGEHDRLPMQHLEALVLHDNSLMGTLPEFVGLLPKLKTLSIHHTDITVGTSAANFICWRSGGILETLATDCDDTTCPCCKENCCASEDCYKDVDWDNIYSRSPVASRTEEGANHD